MTEQVNGGTDNQDVDTEVTEQPNTPNLGNIRKAGQREVLDVLSRVSGQQFHGTKDAAAFIEQLVKMQTSGGNDNSQATQATNKGNTKSSGEMAELREMIANLQSDLKQKDQVVRQTSLQSLIKDTAVRAGFDPQYLDLATNLFESQIAFDETGSFFVKGKDGNVRLDSNGDEMSLDQLATEILKSRPKLAVEDARTGTGTRFGFNVGRGNNDVPDAATDPEGWKAWKQANGVGGKSLKGIGVQVGKTLK